MNNPDHQRMQDQMRERREEQLLFQRFQNVATLKLEQVSRQVQTTKQDNTSDGASGFDINAGVADTNELKMGEEEQRIISRMANMGLREGIIASVASFVVLRRGPKYIGRWTQRRYQNRQPSSSTARSNASYQLSDPKKLTNATNNNPFQNAANARQNEFPRPRGFFGRSIWFVFDTVLSLMVGANVSMVFTDKDAIRQQIVELPLVSGRSLSADTLCDDVVEELRKVREENDPTYDRLQKISQEKTSEPTAASFFMEGIILFCQNCERRRYLEKRIREESGLGKSDPVKIPIPGVPRDCPRLIMGNDETENMFDKDGIENTFLEQFGQDTSWANNFVSDDYDSDQDGTM